MEVLVAYRNDMSIHGRTMLSARSRPELAGTSEMDANELREKAARYRRLATILFDARVIAEVHACARDLEAEAAWIERQAISEAPPVKRNTLDN